MDGISDIVWHSCGVDLLVEATSILQTNTWCIEMLQRSPRDVEHGFWPLFGRTHYIIYMQYIYIYDII